MSFFQAHLQRLLIVSVLPQKAMIAFQAFLLHYTVNSFTCILNLFVVTVALKQLIQYVVLSSLEEVNHHTEPVVPSTSPVLPILGCNNNEWFA